MPTFGNAPVLELRHRKSVLEHDEGSVDELLLGEVMSRKGPLPDGLGESILLGRTYVIGSARCSR